MCQCVLIYKVKLTMALWILSWQSVSHLSLLFTVVLKSETDICFKMSSKVSRNYWSQKPHRGSLSSRKYYLDVQKPLSSENVQIPLPTTQKIADTFQVTASIACKAVCRRPNMAKSWNERKLKMMTVMEHCISTDKNVTISRKLNEAFF